MDRRRRMMDDEGCRAVQQDSGARKLAVKLAVVVVAQNVLVAACLVVTLYGYVQDVRKQPPGDDNVHILVDAVPDITGNTTLQFAVPDSSNMMRLVDNNKIHVNCTGPYVFYMDVCYKSMGGEEARAVLQLQVKENETVGNFSLHAAHNVCRGLHSIAYLRAGQQASLHLYSTGEFKIKNATVGLSYLLRGKCEY